MSSAQISARVWPTVIGECSRFWLRRHRIIISIAVLIVLLGLVLRAAGESESSDMVMTALFAFIPIFAGILTMSGIVSDDRTSGVILLWYQKPGSIVRSYGIRYAIQMAMLAGLAVSVWLLVFLLSLLGLVELNHPIRLLSIMLVFAWLPAAVVFALSAWGVRRDGPAALIVILGSFVIASGFALTEGLTHDIVLALTFPMDSIGRLGGAAGRELFWAIVHVAAHLFAWTAIGFVGLNYTQRVLHRDV